MNGQVDGQLQPIVELTVRGPTGVTRQLGVLVDTGFAGSLTLPMSVIRVLALPWHGRDIGVMADGTIHTFEVFQARVDWNGAVRGIEVFAADPHPLLGTAMLDGHDLAIRMTAGGAVTITAVP